VHESGLQFTEYEDLARVQSELELLTALYSLHTRVETAVSGFNERLWTIIPSSYSNMTSTLHELQTDLRGLPRLLREWPAYDDLSKTISDFMAVLPIISNLCNTGLRRRHWMQMLSAAGQQTSTWNLDPDTFKLKHVMSLNPVSIRVEIDEICRTAKKELEIEAKVQGLGEKWADRLFQFIDYKDRPGAILDPSSILETIKNLDESLTDLTVISSTKVAEALSEEVDSWLAKLSAVSEVIESWSYVQTKWAFMETVFADPDLSEQLPQDAKRFAKVDSNYMKLVSRASHNRHVVNCCNSDHQLKSLLPHLIEQLEQCERSLASYLGLKRANFPRFYFVSDHVLLEFLTRSTRSAAVELKHHLSTIFEGIIGFRLEHDEGLGTEDAAEELAIVTHAVAGRGSATEDLALLHPVDTEGGIDVWISKVDEETQATLKAMVLEARASADNYMVESLISHYPSQVCILALQLNWTAETFRALSSAKSEPTNLVTANKRNLLVVEELIALLHVPGGAAPRQRFCVENLIIVQTHLYEVFHDLLEKKVASEQVSIFFNSARCVV
jgi:dynein heavy chain